MSKKWLLVFAIVIFAAGMVFAQPQNIITVDIGPTITARNFDRIGAHYGLDFFDTSGFGIAAQYERQINRHVSVAGRFAYLGADLGYAAEAYGIRASIGIDINSFSLEGHARLYPFANGLFVGGMLGYARMSTDVTGEIIIAFGPLKFSQAASLDAARNYIIYGVKAGWRIDFGRPGGFILEPAVGFSWGTGLGETLQNQLLTETGARLAGLDDVFKTIEDSIFIGGIRVSLAFGWRF